MKVGDRVGAICGMNHDTGVVEVFGYGVYEGEFPYTEEVLPGSLQEAVKEAGNLNPRILLDNGERVWGCECWWGPEAKIQKRLAGHTVEIVTITEKRARVDGSKAEGVTP